MKKEDLKKLREPFSPEEVKWKIGATTKDKKKGLALPYIGARTVMSRLDKIASANNWKRSHFSMEVGDKIAVICKLSLYLDGKWISKEDGAGTTDYEQIKGSLSDSFKRAAANWGIGRYLYNLDDIWVDVEKRGESYIPAEEPQLPEEALPDSQNKETKKSTKKQKKKPKEKTDKEKESTTDKKFKKIQGFLEEYEIEESAFLAWVAEQADRDIDYRNIEEILEEKGEKWINRLASREFWENNAEEVEETIPF